MANANLSKTIPEGSCPSSSTLRLQFKSTLSKEGITYNKSQTAYNMMQVMEDVRINFYVLIFF